MVADGRGSLRHPKRRARILCPRQNSAAVLYKSLPRGREHSRRKTVFACNYPNSLGAAQTHPPPRPANLDATSHESRPNGCDRYNGERWPMTLSSDAVLLYVLHTGVSGRVSEGRIERHGSAINVYDRHGVLQPYFSGAKLRSWCVVDSGGRPFNSWCSVQPQDRRHVFPEQPRNLTP
jgi:hypothetical protein